MFAYYIINIMDMFAVVLKMISRHHKKKPKKKLSFGSKSKSANIFSILYDSQPPLPPLYFCVLCNPTSVVLRTLRCGVTFKAVHLRVNPLFQITAGTEGHMQSLFSS